MVPLNLPTFISFPMYHSPLDRHCDDPLAPP